MGYLQKQEIQMVCNGIAATTAISSFGHLLAIGIVIHTLANEIS